MSYCHEKGSKTEESISHGPCMHSCIMIKCLTTNRLYLKAAIIDIFIIRMYQMTMENNVEGVACSDEPNI